MIARYALALGDSPYDSHLMDIHKQRDQLSPDYAVINPKMTVPTLVTPTEVLTSSRAILEWVVAQKPENFAESDSDPSVTDWLNRHEAYSIEGLTFGRALLRFAPLRFLIPRLLARICISLEDKARAEPALAEIFLKKRDQNRARIAFFTEGNLTEKVEGLMAEARALLSALPKPQGVYLLGDRPSRLDAIVVVFMARLKMIGAEAVCSDRPDLVDWFESIEKTEAFKAADIWTRFSFLRMLSSR
jgi:glutathione S-transferase